VKPKASDEAYVIFTSGSTGQPNPVAISHGQIAASTRARAAVYPEPPTRFAVLSGLGFDSCLVGLIWTLMAGGTVILPTESDAHDLDALTRLLEEQSLSHSLSVPTLYGLLLSRRNQSARGWPDHMIVAGETCTPALVDRHFDAVPSASLTNEYGPTEATIWATAHHCGPGSSHTPIGTPIPGAWVAVVDHARRILPAGVAGELVIGGGGVAPGYVGRSEPTKFCSASDINGAPPATTSVFCTGDRATLIEGELHFLGRIDDQLNLGGVRIEPGEIETALSTFAGIDAAAVVAVDVRTVDEMIAAATAEELQQALATTATAADPRSALRIALGAFGEPDTRLVAHLARNPSRTSHRDAGPTTSTGNFRRTHRPPTHPKWQDRPTSDKAATTPRHGHCSNISD